MNGTTDRHEPLPPHHAAPVDKGEAIEQIAVFDDIIATVDGVETARLPEGELADLVASYLDIAHQEQQALLETLSVEERLRRVLVHVQHQIQVQAAQEDIHGQPTHPGLRGAQTRAPRSMRPWVMRWTW